MRKIHPSLPLFREDLGDQVLLYTPGQIALASVVEADNLTESWKAGRAFDDGRVARLALHLQSRAQEVVEAWKAQIREPFRPHRLTLKLSNQCNLACGYCFSRGAGGARGGPVVSEKMVLAAARLAARNSTTKDSVLRVALHGGGEPTVHFDLIRRLVALSRRVASEEGVSWWGYLATNGVVARDQALWLGRHFDLVGLSCDGPPAIQDRQRPRANGRGSATAMVRTAKVIRDVGGRIAVRATITPETVSRQTEIVAYLTEVIGASDLYFEPVYQLSRQGRAGFDPQDAPRFVTHFLEAQETAAAQGAALCFSGVRLDELHGPYCETLRDTLHLTPDGSITSCFLCVNGRSPQAAPLIIGQVAEETGEVAMETNHLQSLRHLAADLPARCRECLNAYHCARECPEVCPMCQPARQSDQPPSFRCLVNRGLSEAWLRQAAHTLLSARREHPLSLEGAAFSEEEQVTEFLAALSPEVDASAILSQWQSLQERYDLTWRALPEPLWAQRGYEHDGDEAWRQLTRAPASSLNSDPMSIYVHVPFCERRCRFCDCYSLPLEKENRRREEEFAAALTHEMQAWSRVGDLSYRPLTTVHWGGGTPNCLRPEILASLVRRLKVCFSVTPSTEWALESTSSLLSREHLDWLWAQGFTRLHVGVQTLEEEVRFRIGRRQAVADVVAKLRLALDMGFVTSVDLVYGLPGQTPAGFLNDLKLLTNLNIHGFSLYELQITSRNRLFLQGQGLMERDPLRHYLYFQTGDQFLSSCGYRKNYYSHFALPADGNLYYSHPQRGEDLLALGPTADGVIGHYRYRHPELQAYLALSDACRPPLEGGLLETPLDRGLRPLSQALISGKLCRADFMARGAPDLWQSWLAAALIKPASSSLEDWVLTGNGSWLVNTMLAQIEALPGGSAIEAG